MDLGLDDSLGRWAERAAHSAERVASAAAELRAISELPLGVQPASDFGYERATARKLTAKERRLVELQAACGRRDAELEDLRDRARVAAAFREDAEQRLDALRAEVEALRQRAGLLVEQNGHKSGLFELALHETLQLKKTIQKFGGGCAEAGVGGLEAELLQATQAADVERTRALGLGGRESPLDSLDDDGSIVDEGVEREDRAPEMPRTRTWPTLQPPSWPTGGVVDPDEGEEASTAFRKPAVSRLPPRRLEAPVPGNADIAPRAFFDQDGKVLRSPRTPPGRVASTSCPASRRVRFDDKLQESPRVPREPVSAGHAAAVARSRSPILKRRQPPGSMASRADVSEAETCADANGIDQAEDCPPDEEPSDLLDGDGSGNCWEPSHEPLASPSVSPPPPASPPNGPALLTQLQQLKGEVESASAAADFVRPSQRRRPGASAPRAVVAPPPAHGRLR